MKLMELITAREKQVLDLVSDGVDDKDICKMLNIELCTFKCHLHTLYQKFGVYIPNGQGSKSVKRVRLVLEYLKMKGKLNE